MKSFTTHSSRWLTAAIAIPLFAGPPEPALRVEATWPGLPAASSVLSLQSPVLSIHLENSERVDVLLTLDPRIRRDAATVALPPMTVSLRAFETKIVALSIPVNALQLGALQYSAKLLVNVQATSSQTRTPTSMTMPPLYFHLDRAALLVYRQQALRDRFGAGNFRGLPLNTGYALVESERALLRANIPPRVHPVIARIGAAHTLPGPTYGANGIRFCLAMPGDAYVDSSRGEDLGTFALTVPMARNWVAVNQNGNPLFSGFLDAQGCTPSLFAAPGTPTVIAYSPIYLHTGSDIRGFLSDLNLGDSWPSTMPLFFLNFNSGNTATTTVLADDSEYAQTIFAAATQGMERFNGGHTNALYEWQIREDGDNAGTATNYAPEGHPRVNLKFSLVALEKFTVVHEYGHAVLMVKLNPPISPSDLDYSVTAGESNQHTVQSKEWQLAAAVEGFAHFVSGVAWNDVYPNADGIFYSDATYDLNTFGKYFESNWNAGNFPDQGVELDWAQFFWNYYTDTPLLGGVVAPTQANLLSIWLTAYPWPKNEGFFADFSAAASAVLPPFPALHHQWFLVVAAQAGVDH